MYDKVSNFTGEQLIKASVAVALSVQSVEEAVVRFHFDLISKVRATMLDYDCLQEVVVVVP